LEGELHGGGFDVEQVHSGMAMRNVGHLGDEWEALGEADMVGQLQEAVNGMCLFAWR
jgi:hypothetical protein